MAKKATTIKKSYSLNIIDFLKSLDSRDYKRYENLSEEDKKSISPLIIMRWMSSCWDGNLTRYYAYIVNEYVNKHFWDLTSHKDLQMKLLACCGMGKPVGHNWIKANAVKANNKMLDLIKRFYCCNNEEAQIYYDKLTEDEKIEVLTYFQIDEKEWSKYV